MFCHRASTELKESELYKFDRDNASGVNYVLKVPSSFALTD